MSVKMPKNRLRSLLVFVVLGCGGETSTRENAEAPRVERTSGDEVAEPSDDVHVNGLMGTISERAVKRALDSKLGRFLRCFTARFDDVNVLAGHFEMAFRIAVDGTVRYVHPQRSTIGDRSTERCLLETAGAVRFSRPSGGEAEFTYPLDLDLPDDVREPTFWDTLRVADVVADRGSDVRSSCGGGASVTVYVAPGGRVLAAGAAPLDTDCERPEESERLDCISEAVRDWRMPDPGSYTAKVSFEL